MSTTSAPSVAEYLITAKNEALAAKLAGDFKHAGTQIVQPAAPGKTTFVVMDNPVHINEVVGSHAGFQLNHKTCD